MTLRALDLFSGIGGFSLGLENTGGFETVAFCEINQYCRQVLSKRWPGVPIFNDVRDLGVKNFGTIEYPDIICGGFPCQDISCAGKQLGINAARSGLWWEMLRVITELRPRWVLIENVPALRTNGAHEVITSLEAEGYSVYDPIVVGAWAVGKDQKRERAWILAHSGSKPEQKQGGTDKTIEYQRYARLGIEIGHHRRGIAMPLSTVAGLATALHRESPACDTHKCDTIKPGVGRVANGVPCGVDRLIALGGSVIPAIPEMFGRFILQTEVNQCTS